MATRTTPAQREAALADIAAGRKTVQQVADDLHVTVDTVKRWQRTARAAQQASSAATPLTSRLAKRYLGGAGWAEGVVEKVGTRINVLHNAVVGALVAIAIRAVVAILVGLVTWYLLQVDGEELDRARQKWLSLNERLNQLADDIDSAVEPLVKDGAPWNTDDQEHFDKQIKAFVREIRQVAESAGTNAQLLGSIIDVVTIIFGATLVYTLAVVVIVYVLTPLLATPAAPAAKASQEAAAASASVSLFTVVNGVVGFLGTIGPLVFMSIKSGQFEGDRPNVLGTGSTLKDVHIDWKVTGVS